MPSDSYICERLLGSWLLGDKLLSSTYLIEKLCLVDGITSRDTFWATLGVLGASRGPSGAPWGGLGGVLDPLGIVSGSFGGSREASGVSRGSLGTLLGCLGTPWEALREPSGLALGRA